MVTSKDWMMMISAVVLAGLLAGCVPIQRPADVAGAPPAADMVDGLPVANQLVSAVTAVAEPGLYTQAIDATPDLAAEWIYFTGAMDAGGGVFRAPAGGGETVAVLSGAAWAPMGIAMALDGEALWVTDTATEMAPGLMGALWQAPVSGAQPMVVDATIGWQPSGVEVGMLDGEEWVVMSAREPVSGEAAVVALPAAGGEPVVIASGSPLVEPSGLAIAGDGAVYVVDKAAGAGGSGAVFRMQNGEISLIAEGFQTDVLIAGIALTEDGGALLISSLTADRSRAQVLVIVLASGDKLIVNKVIGENQGAGGLHKAHAANVFAWADSQAPIRNGSCCRVYNVQP
jgi:sugar lactone lactonase YvrE